MSKIKTSLSYKTSPERITEDANRYIRFWGACISISLCMLLLVWAVFISGGPATSYADIQNFASYSQYNNLSLEDTQTGPYTNTVNGTYTYHQLVLVKYSINRRLYPSGTNWSDTLAVDAVQDDTVEFRITWQDSGVGGTADTVVLTDAVPSNVTYIDSQIVSGGGTLSYSAPTLLWLKNNVSPGETGDIRYRARVN
ncbi:hypothetical protein AUJ67_04040 [Candidatus Desantisbacteria bacterium CG1_02_49_89]|nr:MAG: hypothetical protein AUJ67_04040 [Candidatus Desantisbacteria bacterium CG1_02_49_89]